MRPDRVRRLRALLFVAFGDAADIAQIRRRAIPGFYRVGAAVVSYRVLADWKRMGWLVRMDGCALLTDLGAIARGHSLRYPPKVLGSGE